MAVRAQAGATFAAASGAIEVLEAQLARGDDLEREVLAAEGRRAIAKRLADDLKPSRFLAFLLEEERAELAELGSGLFETLTDETYRFAADDSFDIVDLNAADRTRRADSLSGGETFLASLALALALAQMVARGGGRLDAFFLDEGFGSLDPEHLDRAMDGIGRLVAEDDRRLVVLVSHVAEMRAAVEDLIVLDKDDRTGDTVRREWRHPCLTLRTKAQPARAPSDGLPRERLNLRHRPADNPPTQTMPQSVADLARGGNVASTKNGTSDFGRIVPVVVVGVLLTGIVGSIVMGIRARNAVIATTEAQATTITEQLLDLGVPARRSGRDGRRRPRDQPHRPGRCRRAGPERFRSVTLWSPEGTILYSTDEGRIGNRLDGERDRIREALRGKPQSSVANGEISVMVPLEFASGVGEPAVVELARTDDPVAMATELVANQRDLHRPGAARSSIGLLLWFRFSPEPVEEHPVMRRAEERSHQRASHPSPGLRARSPSHRRG